MTEMSGPKRRAARTRARAEVSLNRSPLFDVLPLIVEHIPIFHVLRIPLVCSGAALQVEHALGLLRELRVDISRFQQRHADTLARALGMTKNLVALEVVRDFAERRGGVPCGLGIVSNVAWMGAIPCLKIERLSIPYSIAVGLSTAIRVAMEGGEASSVSIDWAMAKTLRSFKLGLEQIEVFQNPYPPAPRDVECYELDFMTWHTMGTLPNLHIEGVPEGCTAVRVRVSPSASQMLRAGVVTVRDVFGTLASTRPRVATVVVGSTMGHALASSGFEPPPHWTIVAASRDDGPGLSQRESLNPMWLMNLFKSLGREPRIDASFTVAPGGAPEATHAWGKFPPCIASLRMGPLCVDKAHMQMWAGSGLRGVRHLEFRATEHSKKTTGYRDLVKVAKRAGCRLVVHTIPSQQQ